MIDKIKNLNLMLLNLISFPNKKIIWIFGFPKSGTSAIAGLISKRCGKSLTLDTHYLWEPYFSKILNKEIDLIKHIRMHSYPFSKDMIKEPNATVLVPQLKSFFEMGKCIFIVRNPVTNIKSILDRLNLPGDLEEISCSEVQYHWKNFLCSGKGENYVEKLAYKWVAYNETYFKEFDSSKNVLLIRYEDFLQDKQKIIDHAVHFLDYESKYDISNYLEYEFQPRSKNKKSPEKFFSRSNMDRIKKICNELAIKFNYNIL